MGLARAVLSLDLELSITALGGDRKRAIPDLDRLTVLTSNISQARADIREDSPQTRAITEPSRQNFRFAHYCKDVVVAPEGYECDTQVKACVDSLCERFGCLRQPLECTKRVME